MQINITCGQYANDYYSTHLNGTFIPFNEAMIHGNPIYPLFSETFILERVRTHNTTLQEYKKNMHDFLEFIKVMHQYKLITCWFGEDDFCKANLKYLLELLKQENYQGKIKINIINEQTYEILKEHYCENV